MIKSWRSLFFVCVLALTAAGAVPAAVKDHISLPTAASQIAISNLTAPFNWQVVNVFDLSGTAGDYTATFKGPVVVSPTGTAETGVRVNLPSGATGYAYAAYSSTGVRLFAVQPSGVPSSSQGILYNEIYGQGASGGGAVGSNGINTGFGNGVVAGSTSTDIQNCAFGFNANATGASTAFGAGATSKNVGTAIGLSSSALGVNSFALGRSCSTATSSQGSIAIGFLSASTGPNQFVVGGLSGYGISQTWIGDGITSSSPTNTTINATGGSGTNIAGANLTLAGGQSTGTGAEGIVSIATSGSGATGTALNALTNRATVSSAGFNLLSGSYQVSGTPGLTTTTQVTTPTGTETLHYQSGLLTSITTP